MIWKECTKQKRRSIVVNDQTKLQFKNEGSKTMSLLIHMHVRASMYVCGRVASYVTFVRTSESKKVVWKESFKVARSMRATTGFWKKMSFPEVLTVGKIEEENGKQTGRGVINYNCKINHLRWQKYFSFKLTYVVSNGMWDSQGKRLLEGGKFSST